MISAVRPTKITLAGKIYCGKKLLMIASFNLAVLGYEFAVLPRNMNFVLENCAFMSMYSM